MSGADGTHGHRLLYLDSYTVADAKAGALSSDAIGYGITASGAVRDGLRAMGFDLRCLPVDPVRRGRADEQRVSWLLSNYRLVLDALVKDPPDAIFSFHIFAAFPVEIRRMALDLGLNVPIVGYGRTTGRHRLCRSGDRAANSALYIVTIVRMRHHAATRAYVERRTAEGLSKREIIRCLKRYIAREIYSALPRQPHIQPPNTA